MIPCTRLYGLPAMRVTDCELVAIDFECTGSVDAEHPNLPWQIGMVVICGGRVDMSRTFQSLLRVPAGHPFNPYAPGRRAQQRELLAEAPSMHELWPQIRAMLAGRALVAHHAPTERGLLRQLFPMQQFGAWIDTLAIARRAYPHRPEYKLESLIPDLGLYDVVRERCSGGAPHDAFYDAVACATLLERVLQAPGWNESSVENLSRIN